MDAMCERCDTFDRRLLLGHRRAALAAALDPKLRAAVRKINQRDRRRSVYVALMWMAIAAAGGYLVGHGLDATAYDCLRVIQISDDAVYDTWPDEWETHLRGNEG
jgi:hypothetical protein